MWLSAYAESESLDNFNSLPNLDTGLYKHEEVVTAIAQIMRNSKALRLGTLGLIDKRLTAAGAVVLMSAFDESECFQNYSKIIEVDGNLYSSMDLVEQLANMIRGSESLN